MLPATSLCTINFRAPNSFISLESQTFITLTLSLDCADYIQHWSITNVPAWGLTCTSPSPESLVFVLAWAILVSLGVNIKVAIASWHCDLDISTNASPRVLRTRPPCPLGGIHSRQVSMCWATSQGQTSYTQGEAAVSLPGATLASAASISRTATVAASSLSAYFFCWKVRRWRNPRRGCWTCFLIIWESLKSDWAWDGALIVSFYSFQGRRQLTRKANHLYRNNIHGSPHTFGQSKAHECLIIRRLYYLKIPIQTFLSWYFRLLRMRSQKKSGALSNGRKDIRKQSKWNDFCNPSRSNLQKIRSITFTHITLGDHT